MKMARLTITLFGAALLCSASAFAGEINKGKLELAEKVSVDGTPLDPGTYKVEWEGSGPTVQVMLLKGKQTVATFPAHLTQQGASNLADAYASTKEADGSRSLNTIYVGGKPYVLEVEQKAASQQQSSTNPSK
jgi:hypothetical protein